MQENPITKNVAILSIVISLVFLTGAIFWFKGKNESFITFCDVGQGDGAYIHLKTGLDILIDTGPDRQILNCLGAHMPFYDHTIEYAFISHPQKDHYGGLNYLKDRYQIKYLFFSFLTYPNQLKEIVRDLIRKGTTIEHIYSHDQLTISELQLRMIWPEIKHVKASDEKTDPNDFSQIFILKTKTMKFLFTGDALPRILNRLSDQSVEKVDVLKIPHHGSANGLTEKFLILADPTYSVISVGKRNSYGHPSPLTLELLKKYGIKILRTDQIGDITFRIQ